MAARDFSTPVEDARENHSRGAYASPSQGSSFNVVASNIDPADSY